MVVATIINEKEKFELEKQLHEQYAINNNESVRSFIAFVTALFLLFSSFAYVYVYTSSYTGGSLIDNKGIMSFKIYILFAIVISAILSFLSIVALYFGYSNRSNQLIIDRIREEYFTKGSYEKIFGKSYNAKGKGYLTFIQDFFNHFYFLFIGSQIFVMIATFLKINSMNCSSIILICLQFIFLIISLIYRCFYYRKYLKKIINN